MRFLNCCRWFYALPIFDSSFYFLFKLQFQMDFFLDDFNFLGMSYRIYALTLHYTFNNKKWMFINDRWRIGTGIIIASRINHTTKSVFNTFLSLSFFGFCVKWFRFRFFTCDNFFSLAQSKAFTWTLGHTKSNTFFLLRYGFEKSIWNSVLWTTINSIRNYYSHCNSCRLNYNTEYRRVLVENV